MPKGFQSKRQMRKIYAMESRGELPTGTAKRWAKETPDIERLPEKITERKTERKTKRINFWRSIGTR